jgi:hypothetical protein
MIAIQQVGSALRAAIAASLLCALLSLGGCTTLNGTKTPPITTAGPATKQVESYPAWLIGVAEPIAPLVGFTISQVAWRHGYLQRNEVVLQRLTAKMRPLDIMLFSNKGRLSGRAGSGLFSHAAVYLGSERDLQQLGVWKELPQEIREDVRSGSTIIESAQRLGTTLSSLEEMTDTDRIALLRPSDRGTRWRRMAAKDLFDLVGVPFDHHFRLDEKETLFCTEVVDLGMPQLQLPRRQAYGRQIILPDDIASQAAKRRGLSVVAYFRADADGWEELDAKHLVEEISLYSSDAPEPVSH